MASAQLVVAKGDGKEACKVCSNKTLLQCPSHRDMSGIRLVGYASFRLNKTGTNYNVTDSVTELFTENMPFGKLQDYFPQFVQLVDARKEVLAAAAVPVDDEDMGETSGVDQNEAPNKKRSIAPEVRVFVAAAPAVSSMTNGTAATTMTTGSKYSQLRAVTTRGATAAAVNSGADDLVDRFKSAVTISRAIPKLVNDVIINNPYVGKIMNGAAGEEEHIGNYLWMVGDHMNKLGEKSADKALTNKYEKSVGLKQPVALNVADEFDRFFLEFVKGSLGRAEDDPEIYSVLMRFVGNKDAKRGTTMKSRASSAADYFLAYVRYCIDGKDSEEDARELALSPMSQPYPDDDGGGLTFSMAFGCGWALLLKGEGFSAYMLSKQGALKNKTYIM